MTQSYGLKVGNDAYNVTDKDAKFTTKFSTLKIFSSGDLSMETDGNGDGSVSVDHNLGFCPAFFVYCKDTAQWTFFEATSYPNSFFPVGSTNSWNDNWGSLSSGFQFLTAYTDSTKLNIVANGARIKTYNFRYYILVDLARDFSGADGVTLNKNYGFKVSKQRNNVLNCKEYELAYSSKYKSLQYYPENIKTGSMTLPAMWSSPVDEDVEEGTYIDIEHGLGYPPFFLAYFESDRIFVDSLVEFPYAPPVEDDQTGSYTEYSSFCDATRVRLSFYRYAGSGLSGYANFPAETINIKVYIFTEDLTST